MRSYLSIKSWLTVWMVKIVGVGEKDCLKEIMMKFGLKWHGEIGWPVNLKALCTQSVLLQFWIKVYKNESPHRL